MKRSPGALASLPSAALSLAERGYHVIPLAPSTKAAVDRNWTKLRLTPQEVEERWNDNPDLGVGVLLGTEVAPSTFLLAVDIDVNDGVMVDRIRAAIGMDAPAKRGNKGVTFIGRTGAALKKILVKRPKEAVAIIEILASGQQTVLPPSIHPNGQAYHWLDKPLHHYSPEELPLIDSGVLREIELAVKQPDAKMWLVNEMSPPHDGQPGNMHGHGVLIVASMVAFGFNDDQIMRRVLRGMTDGDARVGHSGRDLLAERKKISEWIKSSREKDFGSKDDTGKENPDVLLAKWMRDVWRDGNSLYSRGGQTLAYENGHYKSYSSEAFYKILAHCGNEDIMGLGYRGWVTMTGTCLALCREFPVQPTHRVCLTNGTFDMDECKLHPWSRDDFLISQLDFEYDPKAKCPTYDAFISRTFGPPTNEAEDQKRAIDCFEEFVAMTMFECHDYHRFLVLQGTTRGGKSVLAKVASFMHSPDSISSVMAHDFGNERNRTSMLGKLVNITGETSTVNSVADDYLKLIVAGERVDVRQLYFGAFSTVLPTRIIIATNDPLRTKDTSGAVMERMLVLVCDNYVPLPERDIHLGDKLYEERQGIFNKMVKAWKRLQKRGGFLPPVTSDEVAAQFEVDNNPVMLWLRERTHEGHTIDNPEYKRPKNVAGYTSTTLLYNDYVEWTKAMGFMQMNVVTFGMKLSQIRHPGIDVKSELKWVAGTAMRVRNLSLLQTAKY